MLNYDWSFIPIQKLIIKLLGQGKDFFFFWGFNVEIPKSLYQVGAFMASRKEKKHQSLSSYHTHMYIEDHSHDSYF